MSNYARGAAKERDTIAKLRKMGCVYAARIAGSHSEFDVIGSDNKFVYFVQAKSTKVLPIKPLSIIMKYWKDIEAISKLELTILSLKEVWVYGYRKGPLKINVFPVEFYRRV